MNKVLAVLVFAIISMFMFSGARNYSIETLKEFNEMESPVILKDKSKITFWYGVVLIDGADNVYTYGNASEIANHIGENYKVGDTIK